MFCEGKREMGWGKLGVAVNCGTVNQGFTVHAKVGCLLKSTSVQKNVDFN